VGLWGEGVGGESPPCKIEKKRMTKILYMNYQMPGDVDSKELAVMNRIIGGQRSEELLTILFEFFQKNMGIFFL
jgi:hypothetical protein